MSHLKSAELQGKLKRVRELVELLENYSERGFCLKLNLNSAPSVEESSW